MSVNEESVMASTPPGCLTEFRSGYLDYVEGHRSHPPAMSGLNAADRRVAEAFVKSSEDAAGIDPYSSPPSTDQILRRIDERRTANRSPHA